MKFELTDISYEKIRKVIEKYNEYTFNVFESRARGDYSETSDIDIVVIKSVTKKEFLESIERDCVKCYE